MSRLIILWHPPTLPLVPPSSPSAADPREQGLLDHLEGRARESAIGRANLQHDDVRVRSAGQRCVGALPRRSPDARTRYGVPLGFHESDLRYVFVCWKIVFIFCLRFLSFGSAIAKTRLAWFRCGFMSAHREMLIF